MQSEPSINVTYCYLHWSIDSFIHSVIHSSSSINSYTYLPTIYLSICLALYFAIYPSKKSIHYPYLSIYLPLMINFYSSVQSFTCLHSSHLPAHPSTPSFHTLIYQVIHPSIHPASQPWVHSSLGTPVHSSTRADRQLDVQRLKTVKRKYDHIFNRLQSEPVWQANLCVTSVVMYSKYHVCIYPSIGLFTYTPIIALIHPHCQTLIQAHPVLLLIPPPLRPFMKNHGPETFPSASFIIQPSRSPRGEAVCYLSEETEMQS